MTMRTELAISYDDGMRPVAAKCALCGEQMPEPDLDSAGSVDIIVWFSRHFLDHKRLNHVHDERQIEAESE